MIPADLLELLVKSQKPVCMQERELLLTFTFKRVDGLTYAFANLYNPDITEEQMSVGTPAEMIRKVAEWGQQNGVSWHLDPNFRSITFFPPKEKENEIF